jgi:hypothetical protein
MSRAASYFITNPEFESDSEPENAKYKELCTKQIDLTRVLGKLGVDFVALGNSFSSLYVPFTRHLRCPRCGFDSPIHRVQYEWADYEFKGPCAACRRKVTFVRVDRRAAIRGLDLRIMRWSPFNMILQHNELSDDTEYRYKIPPATRDAIRHGNPLHLETTPWEFIECVKQDKLFRFNQDQIFHMRDDALAGLKTAGWGMPRFVSNFRLAYYEQILHRYNEAIAMDFIIPTRVVFPRMQGNTDIGQTLSMNMLKGQVLDMVAQSRKDPASWHFLPTPVEYATLGGEGAQMATHELLKAGNEELLDGLGIPLEMHRGTLNAPVMATALRMFQQLWYGVPSQYGAWLQWFCDRVSELKNWQPVKASMQPVTQADDIEKKQILLQLASANKVSMSTALSPLGIDVRDEMERIYAEMRLQQELEKEFQQRAQKEAEAEEKIQALEQQQQAPPMQGGMGGMPPGGAVGMPSPASTGQVSPASLQELKAQAEQMAMQFLQMDETTRRSEMIKLKKSDESLHALVKAEMANIRQGAALQGRDMVLQQGGGGGM